ncbi:MAG: ATP-binding cassette domain-containing protein [Chloroflexi bacterium]|nr:ATP-binding cassette domain-containing protein [Chloroflexota bacterium]
MMASGMFLVLPAVVREVVDTVLANDDMGELNRITLLLAGAMIVLTIGSIIGNYHINYVGERIVVDLRRQLYAHLHTLSVKFFTTRRVGELVSRMSSDVTVMRQLLTENLTRLIRHTLTILAGIAIMIVLNWRLAAFILISTPVVAFMGVVVTRFSRRGSLLVRDELANATVVAEEALHNVREVKSFVREDFEANRYNTTIERAFQAALRLLRVRAVVSPTVSLMLVINMILILWYGGREVINDRLSGGELVAFLVYVTIIGQMFSELSWLYTQLQESLGATQRIFELLDTAPDLQDAPGARALDRVEGRITFDDVSFTYDEDEQPVLEDINLDIAPGEIIALVGPSGAGKSTMFNLIPRFYDVTSGALCIDGLDVRQVTQASLREQIGIVPQETMLFGGTIRENILYGRLGASEDEMIAAAEAANAHSFIARLPHGYETIVGERGIRLSGGQRQRVAIARAILKDPRILLLDEATSSLDNESEMLVQEALERLMQNRTTVIIAHRLSTVRIAHRIAVLDRGRIVELGTHDALMSEGGLYARLYEMQFRLQERDALTSMV